MQPEVILIEYGSDVYAQWCQRCNKATQVRKYDTELRCNECNWKMGEKLDSEYVALLRENGKLQ